MEITKKTKLKKVYDRAEFEGYRYAVKMLCGFMGILEERVSLQFLAKYTGTWNADSMLEGLRYLSECAQNGTVFYDLYSEKEKAEEPSRRDTALIAYTTGTEKKRCVFILAGGGYESVCSVVEAFPIAKEMNQAGYNAFVLKYRVGKAARCPNPMDDLARAVAFVAEHAENFHVDMENYAVMGFSAGGHLAASFGTESLGYGKYHLPKPGALLLSYPVITMGEKTHKGSRDALLGKNAGTDVIDRYSIEKLVTEQYPPVFLWQFDADNIVPVENSRMLDAALTRNNVRHEYRTFHGTAHGVGEGRGTDAGGWLKMAVSFWEGGE